ncbi:MAG: hypothetical protein GXP25_00940 [Planctomycetes bacterium]|nr:hypothetical protein [Planctomycetota bacterium]
MDEFFAEGNVQLKPFDDKTKDLALKAKAHVQQMIQEAEDYQAELNRTHKSKFNPHQLYQGITYSQRCAEDGAPDENGPCFRGVELILFCSVEDAIDCVTIDYTPDGSSLVIHFGKRIGEEAQGLTVNTQDKYNAFRIERPVIKALTRSGCEVETQPAGDTETTLYASKQEANVIDALNAANVMAKGYLERLGLEASVYNLIKCRSNVFEMTDDNMADWVKLDDEPRDSYRDVVIITSTRVCRRCKAEWQDLFLDYTKSHPHVTFGIAFTDKPKLKFIPKVFDEDCGGVRHSGKVTPFLIFYKEGVYKHYVATTREEPPPDIKDLSEGIKTHLGLDA